MKQLLQENKLTLLYILIAYAFSVAMRFIWVYQFKDYAPFHFNGEFMINTNDGYYWAEGARDILAGFHQANDSSPIDQAPSQLTAFFANILPFKFETVIFYMPVFLSSLIVIPIILISKTLKNLNMGLIAALLASIAWSYYNRTMAGYYDTDMLTVVLPMFLLWSIIWAINTQRNIYLLITAVDILIYRWWYPQSYSLEFAFFGFILVYALVFDRKNLYYYKLLAIMMFAMMNGNVYVRMAMVLGSYYLLTHKEYNKYTFHLLGASIVAFLATGGFNPIWHQLHGYIFRQSVSQDAQGLHFFTVMQTVREAGHIPFETFANRISGHVVTFIVACLGYGYLLYRYRIMLLSLPLVGLGFLAYVGGLRFTVYAVPMLAFGIAFLITELSSKMPTKKLYYLSMTALTLAVLFPNYKHIEAYKVPTVFNADEVNVLANTQKKVSREDYMLAWWDYGFPLRYYADVKTLADGAQHSGDRNFPISYVLTHPQAQAAKMARLDVEYTEKSFEDNGSGHVSLVEKMMKDYGFDDVNDFLLSLEESDMKLPQKTRDVYLYLPYRMLNIYPTVTLFSNLDLASGKAKKRPFFYVSRNFKETKNAILLGNGVSLNKHNSTLTIGNKTLPIRRFIKTAYTADGKLHVNSQFISFASDLNVIYMSNYHTFLLVDEGTYNSTYIQLFVLENYDKSLFQEVTLTPSVKIYKLKK